MTSNLRYRNPNSPSYNSGEQQSNNMFGSDGSHHNSHFYSSQGSGYSSYSHCSTPEEDRTSPHTNKENYYQSNIDHPDLEDMDVDCVEMHGSESQRMDERNIHPTENAVELTRFPTGNLVPFPKQELSKPSSFGLENLTLPFISVKKLGSGGHSIVEEVKTTTCAETYARKSVVRRRKISSSSHMAHLKNELAILKELQHPNLVKLIGAYTDTECSHIIMTPVADQNLADYMRSMTLHEVHHLAKWMEDLSSAVTYLHANSVKHLDIKPQNILVHNNNILLADFGAARSMFREHTDSPRNLPFTPMYCAPEILVLGELEYSADIFSLGCVFSEMTTLYCGHSIRDFEQFRSHVDGSKEFHLTISKTINWLKDIIDSSTQTPDDERDIELTQDLLPIVVNMLSEVVGDRPAAKDIHAFFAFRTCDYTAASLQKSCTSGDGSRESSTQSANRLGSTEAPRDEKSPSGSFQEQLKLDRMYCKQCDDHPKGFGSKHALRRHRTSKHREPVVSLISPKTSDEVLAPQTLHDRLNKHIQPIPACGHMKFCGDHCLLYPLPSSACGPPQYLFSGQTTATTLHHPIDVSEAPSLAPHDEASLFSPSDVSEPYSYESCDLLFENYLSPDGEDFVMNIHTDVPRSKCFEHL